MNANTRLRLWKETRALLPRWGAAVALMALPVFLGLNHVDALAFSWSTYVFGCALLGSYVIGQEFQHRTMSVLLSQPVQRRRIFGEKLLVLGATLMSLLLWFAVLEYFRWRKGNSRFTSDDDAFAAAAVWVLPAVLAFCTGPGLTMLARATIGGVALTFLCPFGVFVFCLWVLPDGLDSARRWVSSVLVFVAAYGVYAGLLFLWGCRRFQRLEDVNLLAQEFAAPRQFDNLFARLTSVLAPGRDSQLANLLRKEVRLQRPAVFVAVFLVAVWLAFIVVRRVHPALGAEVLIVPSILLGLGIPVIAGIVAVAEERSLGVHEWHLTLPVSARRQWCVKVLVALGVNVAFGILLPGLLAHASSWLADNPQLVAEIPGRDVSPFLIANLVIFCAALYASSASSNPMRALVGIIVIFVGGGLAVNAANLAAQKYCEAVGYFPSFLWGTGWPSQESAHWLAAVVWPAFWALLGTSFYFRGLENFERTLSSLRHPVRHLCLIFLVMGFFLTFVMVWEMVARHVSGLPGSYLSPTVMLRAR